jgi:hypothetical protein
VSIEYRLRFEAPDGEAVADVLRRLPAARAATPLGNRFDLGDAGHDWPQATVEVEPGGVYFCDHCGGSGRALFGEVVARLASAFGVVTVEEL